MKIIPIGTIENNEKTVRIVLEKKYAEGLKGLDGYSHVQILWWADGCDNERSRSILTEKKPYTKGPEELGIFATRSPERPNPIAVSNVDIAYVDAENGIVGLYYVDAFDGTQVLDLKPYTPSIDRIENIRNIPSQKMLEKCGYKKEGLIRQGKMVNTWCDYYIYGILKSDILVKEM